MQLLIQTYITDKDDAALESIINKIIQIQFNNVHLIKTVHTEIQCIAQKIHEGQYYLPRTILIIAPYLEPNQIVQFIEMLIEKVNTGSSVSLNVFSRLVTECKQKKPDVLISTLYNQIIESKLSVSICKQIIPLELQRNCCLSTRVVNPHILNSEPIVNMAISQHFIGDKKFLGHGGFGRVETLTVHMNEKYITLAIKEMNGNHNSRVSHRHGNSSDDDGTPSQLCEIDILQRMFEKDVFSIDGLCNVYGYWYSAIAKTSYVCMQKYEPFNMNDRDDPKYSSSQMIGCMKAIRELHKKGFVHRDIKEQNMLVNSLTKEIIICDFGIVIENKPQKIMDQLPKYYGNSVPEIENQSLIKYPEKIDVYQLGKMWKRLLNQNGILSNEKQKQDLKDLFQNMIISDPEDRPTLDTVMNTFSSIFSQSHCDNVIEPNRKDALKNEKKCSLFDSDSSDSDSNSRPRKIAKTSVM